MKAHNPELISALLDGELKGLRRRLVQRHVGRCAICAAEYRHLLHVRDMLAANPIQPRMSDSPEFFWSKIKREIQATAGQTARVPVPRLSLADWLAQQRYAVASATTALVAVVAVILTVAVYRSGSHSINLHGRKAMASMAGVETTIPHASATEFETDDDDATVIWTTGLPWSKDIKDMQTKYSQIGS